MRPDIDASAKIREGNLGVVDGRGYDGDHLFERGRNRSVLVLVSAATTIARSRACEVLPPKTHRGYGRNSSVAEIGDDDSRPPHVRYVSVGKK